MCRLVSPKYLLNLVCNKTLLVDDAIYAYRASILQDRTNCHWGKFPKYAGSKNSCPDFWCIIELEPDNGLGAFQQDVVNFGKTRTQLRSSPHPAERLLSVHRLRCVQAWSEFIWLLHYPGLKSGQCFLSHKAAPRHKIKIVKLILLWHLALWHKDRNV